ncbi:cytochrome C oxidase subunit IV family protein [Sporosarcina sp. HYO08]|uniref:cytochrome C oxidase subunit IV family protein n=1 Tax=Sporosarcina sp. HYO08 TaxID=1759557 RepID=UPI0007950B3D|nr:cytochrome C oxidase subunit IV family protein [Sporosarcina sp. HYO08]KXH79870.1 cytochrome B6 [Sporosarcina sp. HYO08]
MADIQIYKKSPVEYELEKRRAKKSMQAQIIMFSLMIFLTLVSFTMVVAFNADILGFSKYFVIPILLLFAAVQVGLQLYYFMHMNEKGHGFAKLFMYTGMLLAFSMLLGYIVITWW